MNNTTTPKIKRETKSKIRVDFERAALGDRLRAKFLNLYTLKNIVWYIFRFLLLLGLSYVILFPFISKIATSFMTKADLSDITVRLIPKHPTLATYKAIILENNFFECFFNSFILSLVCGLAQTFVCAFIGYGFAKFKFKGNKLLFLLVIFTMIVPHSTLRFSMMMKFMYFDVLGIMNLLGGGVFEWLNITGGRTFIELLNTNWPVYILSLTGLGFKNGLYIFLFRQFYRGIPDELEESAYIDGYGVMKTFAKIIVPLSTTMLITVFMFAFCWQWTDNFYTELFYTLGDQTLIGDIVTVPPSLYDSGDQMGSPFTVAITNTAGILILIPLIIFYIFGQKYIVQGIAHSGLTAD